MTPDLGKLKNIVARASEMIAGLAPESVEQKGYQDYVTDVDKRIEGYIREELLLSFPGVRVIGEESISPTEELTGDVFIVDPLDGTGNFVSGFKNVAVSVALMSGRATVLAAIADVWGGNIYAAELGKGAWYAGQKLVCPSQPSGLICLSSGVVDLLQGKSIYHLLRGHGKLRNIGTQALHLCNVASGCFSLNISHEAKVWDDAAGRLVVEESGARYVANPVDASVEQADSCLRSIAAHPRIFDSVVAAMSEVFY